MKLLRAWGKAAWAIAISGLLWIPVLLLTAWMTLHPSQDEEVATVWPLLMQLAFVGLGLTFAILWLVFAAVQWVRSAGSSHR
ncbi:MAG TPA: hypothetical protein VL333_00095 [Candidatus Saccharimonadales bacterium]|nr:hypothetical protein [Candidatus Saccharimonadales bacterium]